MLFQLDSKFPDPYIIKMDIEAVILLWGANAFNLDKTFNFYTKKSILPQGVTSPDELSRHERSLLK